MKTEVSRLTNENASLKKELQQMQQYSRINNLEITGIPEKNK